MGKNLFQQRDLAFVFHQGSASNKGTSRQGGCAATKRWLPRFILASALWLASLLNTA
jgi:hypothetical protein